MKVGMVLPVVHMIMRPFISFFRDYILRLGIPDGWRGFLISSMNAFAELVMAAKVVQIVHESRLRAKPVSICHQNSACIS